jgi:phosphoenolpyruvate-protein phosphotransferase
MIENKIDSPGQVLRGIRISPGLAIGKAFIYQDILERSHHYFPINQTQVKEQMERIEVAINTVRNDLRLVATRIEHDFNEQVSAIFLAQEQMLSDGLLNKQFEEELMYQLVNAEQIVFSVLTRWALALEQKGGITSERADDIRDLCRRLLNALIGISLNVLEDLPTDSIVVARHLLPSDTILLSRSKTCAVVVEFGGSTSHAALLTRGLNIPAIGRIPGLLNVISNGDTLLLDGTAGILHVNPDISLIAAAMKKHKDNEISRRHSFETQRKNERLLIYRDTEIKVFANVNCRDDINHALHYGADGIGLFRLEGLYMSRKIQPSETDLFDYLRDALSDLENRPVAIRLLDMGGDKRLPYLHLPHDPAPLLGLRGIRVLLKYPDLLHTQLKALVKLSMFRPVQIIVPMVTLVDDMINVRQMLDSIINSNSPTNQLLLGAMIETPAAALYISEIAKASDFLCIGTNDLTQYTMAAGRENEQAELYYSDHHPAVIRLLKIICSEAGNLPITLCGELAGNPEMTSTLLDIGIRRLSIAPGLIPEIKDVVSLSCIGETKKDSSHDTNE